MGGWGVIGKLGGRAGSPHYWGWIAFAGRSRAILAILRHQRQHQHRDRDHPSHYRSLETFGLFFDLKDTKCSLNWHCTITSVAASPVSSSIYQLSINLCQVERSPAFITYWSFKIPPSHILAHHQQQPRGNPFKQWWWDGERCSVKLFLAPYLR